MSFRATNNTFSLALFFICIIISVVGCSDSTPAQSNPPDEQNIEMFVQQQFDATATVQSRIGVTQTLQAAFDQALTATSIPFVTETAEARQMSISLTATAEVQVYTTSARGADGAFILGNESAPVTLVLFTDYACSHCQAYFPEIRRFIREYVATGQAKLEYRLFATSAGGQQSVFLSQIAECADEQNRGAFWQVMELLYEIAGAGRYFQDGIAREIAQELDLDYDELLQCSQSAEQITIDMEFGRTVGVEGTPAVMVRDETGTIDWITHNGTTYNRGGVPFEVLSAVVSRSSNSTSDTACDVLVSQVREGSMTTTASGLQYKVLEQGDGPTPVETSIVTAHYRGCLLNGLQFDSSYDRGQPSSFPLSNVISGWTEGVQLMPQGSRFLFYIPSELAYGEQGRPPTIPPNTPLLFEVELLGFQ